MTDFNLIPLLPEIFLALIAMGLLIVGVFQGNRSTDVVCYASAFGCFLTILVLIGIDWDRTIVLNGMFVMDKFAAFMKILVLIGLLVSIVLSVRYIYQEQMARFEMPILILLAGLGMMLMVSSHNLLGVYMALELQSLSLYVLAAFRKNSLKSAEAGTKYFILGALSSGMILFGTSLVYGFTGTIDFELISKALQVSDELNLGVLVGLVFILAGLAFKISAVPFHMWTPDVYQGAPTHVTALFAIVPKIAAMALLIRLLFEPFAPLMEQSQQIIIFLSAASMLVGAFAAIVQDNIKRLMAYSSIGNMGYALIGVAVGNSEGLGAVVLYLSIYLFMTAGVFAVILSLRRAGVMVEKISDMAGMSQTNPWMAYTLAILMFSMSGIPPMAGFFGKLFIFQVAIDAQLYALAIFGILTSVVAAYYYLRVIKVMFFDDPLDAFEKEIPFARRAVMVIAILFVFGFTVKPNKLYEATHQVTLPMASFTKINASKNL